MVASSITSGAGRCGTSRVTRRVTGIRSFTRVSYNRAMTYYGTKHLADAFRTVRRNTIAIAEEIPAEQYGFRPAPLARTVAEQLTHITVQTRWQIRVHEEGVTFIDFERFGRELARGAAEEQLLTTKEEIIRA